MGNIYIGDNSIARKVNKLYVGVNGIARQVQNVYVGVNGIARQVYSAFDPTILSGSTTQSISWSEPTGTHERTLLSVSASRIAEAIAAGYTKIVGNYSFTERYGSPSSYRFGLVVVTPGQSVGSPYSAIIDQYGSYCDDYSESGDVYYPHPGASGQRALNISNLTSGCTFKVWANRSYDTFTVTATLSNIRFA